MSFYWDFCGDVVGILATHWERVEAGFFQKGIGQEKFLLDMRYSVQRDSSVQQRMKSKYPEEESHFQKDETDIFSTILPNK